MSVRPLICVGWLIGEFFLVLAVRTIVAGDWRGYLPGTEGLLMSIVLAVPAHAYIMLGSSMQHRMIVGPALWAVLTVYGVAVNPAVVACAFGIEQPNYTYGYVWVFVGVAYALVAVGWSMAWTSVVPEKRKHFFAHESLQQYLERKWDTRNASRADWGDSLDAARAHVVLVWNHRY